MPFWLLKVPWLQNKVVCNLPLNLTSIALESQRQETNYRTPEYGNFYKCNMAPEMLIQLYIFTTNVIRHLKCCSV